MSRAQPAFSVQLVEAEPGGLKVLFAGRFDFNAHPSIRQALKKLRGRDIHNISLDLAKVNFLDSSGLGMILLFQDENLATTISAISQEALEAFEVANLHRIFEMPA